jgi:hypothetical protein
VLFDALARLKRFDETAFMSDISRFIDVPVTRNEALEFVQSELLSKGTFSDFLSDQIRSGAIGQASAEELASEISLLGLVDESRGQTLPRLPRMDAINAVDLAQWTEASSHLKRIDRGGGGNCFFYSLISSLRSADVEWPAQT